VPVHVVVVAPVKAICGNTWNWAVVWAVAPIASVILTVKIQSLAATPAGGAGNALVNDRPLRPMPVGRTPEVTAYLKGAMPEVWNANVPHTVTQPASTAQGDRGVHGVPVTTRRLLIEIELLKLAVAPDESATLRVKRKLPRFAGVPVTVPVGLMLSPAGRAPSLISHV